MQEKLEKSVNQHLQKIVIIQLLLELHYSICSFKKLF